MLESAIFKLPDSVTRYDFIYKNGIDADAQVVSIERSDDVTDTGRYYYFKLRLDSPSILFSIKGEVKDSFANIDQYKKLPIRYLPNTREAIVLFYKL